MASPNYKITIITIQQQPSSSSRPNLRGIRHEQRQHPSHRFRSPRQHVQRHSSPFQLYAASLRREHWQRRRRIMDKIMERRQLDAWREVDGHFYNPYQPHTPTPTTTTDNDIFNRIVSPADGSDIDVTSPVPSVQHLSPTPLSSSPSLPSEPQSPLVLGQQYIRTSHGHEGDIIHSMPLLEEGPFRLDLSPTTGRTVLRLPEREEPGLGLMFEGPMAASIPITSPPYLFPVEDIAADEWDEDELTEDESDTMLPELQTPDIDCSGMDSCSESSLSPCIWSM